jgi:hypothetical protein
VQLVAGWLWGRLLCKKLEVVIAECCIGATAIVRRPPLLAHCPEAGRKLEPANRPGDARTVLTVSLFYPNTVLHSMQESSLRDGSVSELGPPWQWLQGFTLKVNLTWHAPRSLGMQQVAGLSPSGIQLVTYWVTPGPPDVASLRICKVPRRCCSVHYISQPSLEGVRTAGSGVGKRSQLGQMPVVGTIATVLVCPWPESCRGPPWHCTG